MENYVRGPWTTWKEVDSTRREALWQYFKGLYQWPPSSESLVYTAWENSYKKRFSGIMQSAREDSLQQALDANQENLKRPPTGLELYARSHTNKLTQEYITPKAEKTADTELWCDVSGGIKKGRIYGWGSVSNTHRLLVGSLAAQSTGTSPENMEAWGGRLTMMSCVVIYERMCEEMREEMEAQRQELDAKAAEIEARRQEMREEMDVRVQEIEATRQDITAKQRHIDAGYEEMEKMITTLQNRKGGNLKY
uniref:Uncharacterized protein n=1 Tax=Lactuca sativa TaxID=4236 RepID=A0A9R1WAG4_LACSA|nr:hypothetical protein LSAT_V11C200076140 [Lactuca sativa]